MMTPCFVNVTDEAAGVDLLDLTAGGEYASNDIQIQTLTAFGLPDKTYIFTKDRKGNWFWKDADTGATIEAGDVTFFAGDGLWVSGVDAATLTSAGAVSTKDITINLQEGSTACGNMTPVAIDLTSIVPGGEYASNDIQIQTLTSTGLPDKTYIFTKDRKGNWFWKDADTGATIEVGDVSFDAGAGLWVGGVNGATITIPGPTL